MSHDDRLHALDAVRGFALLLGIVLHATMTHLEGIAGWVWIDTPSTTLAMVWYVIHMFRMSAFFLMAGFFGCMTLERRGARAFIEDRAKRIVIPLVVGLPVVTLLTMVGLVLGGWLAGIDLAAHFTSLQETAAAQDASRGGMLGHLWFLYYLLMFYAAALLLRAVLGGPLDRGGRLRRAAQRLIGFVMSGYRAPVLLGLPLAAYFYQLEGWSSWIGLPAPFPLVPQIPALIGYGLAFGLGWLLHGQARLLLDLRDRWLGFCAAAAGLTAVAVAVGGATPRWEPYLEGNELALYAAAYMVGVWCWVLGLTGAALRFLSAPSTARRYLADSSYWLYLMHVSVLVFFAMLLGPLHWHWSIKYSVTLAGTVPILLLSYHYFVRYTFIGVILNGRRHARPVAVAARGTAPPAQA